MTEVADFDVAVIGYGPTGATLASLLAQCGLSVAVIEREAQIYHLPRAVHFDDEVMRVFQTVGIADELTKKVRLNPGMRFVDSDGNLLLDWPRPQGTGPMGWNSSYRFHQPDLEELLRRAFESHARAHVFDRCEVTALEEEQDTIRLSCIDRRDGSDRTLSAKYVVGCDGARSFMRRSRGSWRSAIVAFIETRQPAGTRRGINRMPVRERKTQLAALSSVTQRQRMV